MSQLSSPLKLPQGATLRNRLFKAAMSEGLAQSHAPGEELTRLYARWGRGGLGAMITGNIQVDRLHLERAANLVLDDQLSSGDIERYKRFTSEAQHDGALLIAQLGHSGRATLAAVNATPLAPSPVPLLVPGVEFGNPQSMTREQVAQVVAQFRTAARQALAVGFAGIEIHAAHGYLLTQFLSPLTNQRDDEWGGSLENRARLLLDIVRAVRDDSKGRLIVGVKLNATDFQKGAFSLAEAVQVARWLDELSVDFLEVTGGTYERSAMASTSSEAAHQYRDDDQSTAAAAAAPGEAYFVEYAAAIRKAVKCSVAATGGFRSRAAIESALSSGAADLIGIGRPLCAAPECVRQMLDGAIDKLPAAETELSSKPLALPGPELPPQMVQNLKTFATLNWFSLQLRRLGQGQEPDRSTPLLDALQGYAQWEAGDLVARNARLQTSR
jgi:2,4-dienoyl-CoA reductase-like NADH-dependent reductase (Old Yellow Enzyme family)